MVDCKDVEVIMSKVLNHFDTCSCCNYPSIHNKHLERILKELMPLREVVMLEASKDINYNSTDMGEVGVFIRSEYAKNVVARLVDRHIKEVDND